MQGNYQQKSWLKFNSDPPIKQWAEHCLPLAYKAINSPQNKHWFRHQNTWFVGVNLLENDGNGKLANGSELTGEVVEYIKEELGFKSLNLDKGQISVCYRGYPKKSENESQANHLFRLNRDAAHIDGLLAEGEPKKRYLREFHNYILGIPLTLNSSKAAPLVVWEGSHQIIQVMLQNAFAKTSQENWGDVDLTQIYQQTRKQIFDQCQRRVIHAEPGQCYLLHRFALHGMSPWLETDPEHPEDRIICYFRPETNQLDHWLNQP